MVFLFRERNTTLPDGDISTSGEIQIKIDGKTVFELDCRCNEERYIGNVWKPGEIEGFIEGPWVNDVKQFAHQVSSLYGQQKDSWDKKRKEEELQNLKDKFGI
jgi:hypothetical protein